MATSPNYPFLGHETIFQQLLRQKAEGHLPHAMLWLGTEGIGKKLVAEHLIRHIFCEKAPELCGTCQSCHLMERGQHPDLQRIAPDEGRIKIDTIRELKKTLVYPPLVASRRVVLILDAHLMNAAAANALLKSLEEPPPDTLFILITHALGWVPRTILSRCHQVFFSPLSDEAMKAILQKQDLKISPDLVDFSQGSVAQALRFQQVAGYLPDWNRLTASPGVRVLGFDEAYGLVQELMAQDRIADFLQTLLLQAHQALVRGSEKYRFDLLTFADKILEVRDALRWNINPAMHVTRLLLYFQETKESRL